MGDAFAPSFEAADSPMLRLELDRVLGAVDQASYRGGRRGRGRVDGPNNAGPFLTFTTYPAMGLPPLYSGGPRQLQALAASESLDHLMRRRRMAPPTGMRQLAGLVPTVFVAVIVT